MILPRLLRRAAGVLLALAPLGAAQEAAPAGGPLLPHPARVLFDEPTEGVHWAAGPAYKASVDGRGLTFVPFLGSDAPRNEPLGLELVEVTVGGDVLPLAPPARPARAGDTVTLARGPVVERFRCVPQGVELSIEVDLPADARGPLHLRYARRGGQSVTAAPGGGLRFVGELGEVRMAAAVAVEGGGQRVPVASEPDDQGFRFVVPAEVVARSGGRVLVDPLISTGTITSNSLREDVSVDTAADVDVGYYVAVERAFSATDRDVFVYRVNATGGLSGTFVATIDFTTDDWTEPTVAARLGQDDLLVAATVGSGAARRVFARWSDSTGSSVGTPFAATISGVTHSPDLGVESTGNFLLKRWCLVAVFEGTSGVGMVTQLLGGSGFSVGRTGTPYGLTATGPIRSPSVSEVTGPASGFGTTRFVTAFAVAGSFSSDVRVRIWDRDLVPLADHVVGSAGFVSALDVGSPGAVDPGTGTRTFPVAFAATSAFSSVSEVSVIACDENGALGAAVRLGELMDSARGVSRLRPSVASDGERWMVTFDEQPAPFLPRRTYGVTGGYAGGRFGLTERRLLLSSVLTDSFGPSTLSMWAGGDPSLTGRRFLTAHVAAGATAGARTEPPSEDAAGVQECEAAANSTGSSAWLSALGRSDVQSPKLVRLEAAPAGQFSLLFTAASANYVPGIGGSDGNLCLGADRFGRYNAQIGVTSAQGTRDVILDPTAIPQPLGTTSALVGESWWFQAWFRDVNGAGPTSNLSNAVRVTFDH